MHTIRDFPYAVHEVEHIEIPMADGCRLAARMWLPVGAEDKPCPAILEYIPYRKNDFTAARDAVTHGYFAGHGYACIRVDLRGAGESEGVLRDEYLQQELDDGVEIIAWIAAQDWCDGNVGMMGISWGGFNGLQVAALQPPALKAIVSCSSTVDRYADDVHYMGGCLLVDNFSWASVMFGRNACPPDPRHVGPRWRELWHQRMQGSGLWLEPWLVHQHRDAYWRHGSVCEHFERVRCPVYAVSGWADGYCNTVFHALAGLAGPRKGLIGPWAHTYPHIGEPGPAIGFLQECLRWWDHWLRDRDTGIMDEPMLRVWMQDSAPPRGWYESRSGRWVAEPDWPASQMPMQTMLLGGDGRLLEAGDTATPAALPIASPLSVGLFGGKWCSYAQPGDQPVDQRMDDSGSLVFDSAPLAQPLEILGEAVLELELESDAPAAMLAVRINQVTPNGEATRVTYGLLNLAHRYGHDAPSPLVPGQRYDVRVPLKHVAQRFAQGHRLRVAISTSYWPVAWPSPTPTTLTIHTENSRLLLPRRTARPEDAALPDFAPPEGAAPLDQTQLQAVRQSWQVQHDLAADEHSLRMEDGTGTFRINDNGLTVSCQGREQYGYRADDPASACAEAHWEISFARDDWQVKTVTTTQLEADAEAFHVKASLQAFENDELVYEQDWQKRILRELV